MDTCENLDSVNASSNAISLACVESLTVPSSLAQASRHSFFQATAFLYSYTYVCLGVQKQWVFCTTVVSCLVSSRYLCDIPSSSNGSITSSASNSSPSNPSSRPSKLDLENFSPFASAESRLASWLKIKQFIRRDGLTAPWDD